MDVKSGHPWWPLRRGLLRDYPPLSEDCSCDVAIVGAGITGALVARALVDAGLDVVVLDQRDAGWGSTAASTALLQYEIDTELLQLGRQVGSASALHAFRACAAAVRELGMLAQQAGDIGYRECASLYFASSARHVARLHAEYAERRRQGFDVAWLDAEALRGRFGFGAPAAMVSHPAAQLDPYAFAHALFADCHARGMRLFDRTGVESIRAAPTHVHLRTRRDCEVRAAHVVVAAGYETESFVPARGVRNRSSYAFVSEPLDPFPAQLRCCIAWETARPYLYWRDAGDRLIVGGEDDAIDIAAKRDARVHGKSMKLLKRMHRMFPELPLDIGFAWAGTFAETRDGLPFFGSHPKRDPRILFAMAYGGNGISFSVIGARLLRDAILGRPHDLADLFGFGRAA